MDRLRRSIVLNLFVLFQPPGHYAYAVVSPSLESRETIVLEYFAAGNEFTTSCGNGHWRIMKIKGTDLSPDIVCAGAYPEVASDGKPLPECNADNECLAKDCTVKKNIEAVTQTEKPCTFHIQDWHFVEMPPPASETPGVSEEGGEANPGPDGL